MRWILLAALLAAAVCGCDPCKSDKDCDDGIDCTVDTCEGSKGCSQLPDDTLCNDDNPCTDNRCLQLSGCQYTNNQIACDDDNACTADDLCAGGTCAGTEISCDDQNLCTDDSCDPATGCVNLNNTIACDDVDACTVGDACADGGCRSGPDPLDCDDQNVCTDDSCDPATGCVNADTTDTCIDGDLCTQDGCDPQDGCTFVDISADCDDDDLCTDDSCDPATGCVNTDITDTCIDGNLCTQDGCDPQSGCTFTDISADCDDSNGCTRDSCDPATGCQYQQCSPYADCPADACICWTGYLGDGFDCEPPCGDDLCWAGEDLSTCAQDCDYDLVVVVEDALLSGLQADLDQYVSDLQTETFRAYLLPWTGGTVTDLRNLLIGEAGDHAIEGAFLLGNLPAAWYEQDAFGEYEQFPFELFLMDLDATFTDADTDDIFDAHSPLELDIFVSRLNGTESQLQAYFVKLHDYRVNGPTLPVAALNFMDDEWSGFPGFYGLEYMYTTVDIVSDPADSTTANYVSLLTGAGNEFVMQWVHSTPSYMHIYGTGEGYVDIDQIIAENHKGAFFNLFNCSAARFTEDNLATTYLTRTDYGLAIVGTTKEGGMVTPRLFHGALGNDLTWGEAFVEWYNNHGNTDDEWFFGMVILGDPLLRVPGDVTRRLAPEPPANEWQKDRLREIIEMHAGETRLKTFEEYRAANPSFF